MIVLLDIGNTAVTYGLYGGGRMHETGSCLYDNIPKIIRKCLKKGANQDFNIVISSVVPKATEIVKKAVKGFKGIKIWIAKDNLPVPIKHKYRHFNQLGSDRAVTIYGASRIYKAPLLIIDFGTAVTFDFISKKGVFEGGMIIPGPEISFQTLLRRAALIPNNARLPHEYSSFLGKDTYACLNSGVLEGYAAMTEGLIQRFKKRFGPMKVVATGGFLRHLKPFVNNFDIVAPQLCLNSLLILFKDQSKQLP